MRLSLNHCGPIYQPTVFWSPGSPGLQGKERVGKGRENLKSGREKNLIINIRFKKIVFESVQSQLLLCLPFH